jgi:hypothetical protein
MIKNQSSQKAKAKEKMVKLLDEYYEKFEKSSNEPGFNINSIEQLMMEQQKQMRELMLEANSELTSSIIPEDKKNALSAKKQ